MKIFETLNDIFLRMTWLYNIIESLVENIFNLSLETRLGNSIHFFIYDTKKIKNDNKINIFIVSYIKKCILFPSLVSRLRLNIFSTSDSIMLYNQVIRKKMSFSVSNIFMMFTY